MDWAQRDFRVDLSRPRRLLERGATASVVTVLGFAVMLLAVQHEGSACRDACYDGPLRTYQPGHAWTAYEGAWQWQAQWTLGMAAFLTALGALATTSRYRLRRWTTGLLLASLALAAGWVLWRVLEPAPPA